MVRATCPLCGDYSGEPSSVEAHISAKTDELHKGELGHHHRAEMMPGELAEAATEPSTDAGDEQGEGSADAGDTARQDTGGSGDVDTDAVAIPTASVQEASYESDGESGALKLAIGGTAAYVIYQALRSDRPESDEVM